MQPGDGRHGQGPAGAATPETAGRHLVTRVPVGRQEETIATLIERLAGVSWDFAGDVHVADSRGTWLGAVPVEAVLAAPRSTTLGSIAQRHVASVAPDLDQEHVATFALDHGIAAVPVVDAAGRLLGVVPPQALLEVLRHEHVEDLHRLAGIRREGARARSALEAPPQRRARDRLPWLLAGLAGSALATLVMAGFERALAAHVAIAFFVPGIVYLADAIGTQTEAIAVRGLSLSRAPMARLVGGELRTGLLIGLTLSALAFVPIWFVFGSLPLAWAVALSLAAASSVATTLGLVLPWLLERLGTDPAFGSGPVATILQDVLSLLIYFALVTLIVL
jgi:magnesium transporter